MAIVADLETFKLLFPELTGVGDPTITFYLEIYTDSLAEVYWAECFNQAILYRSAHEIALSQNRQANAQTNEAGQVITSTGSGAITSASAGAISVSYAQTASATQGSEADAYFSLTQYGQQYLTLKRECMPYGVLAVATCQ